MWLSKAVRRISLESARALAPSVVLKTSCASPFFIKSTMCGRPSSTLLTCSQAMPCAANARRVPRVAGDRLADHLGHKRHRARRSRIDLEDVDVAALDGILHVHQAHHIERQGEVARLLLQTDDDRGGERVCGERAGAVARMNACLL